MAQTRITLTKLNAIVFTYFHPREGLYFDVLTRQVLVLFRLAGGWHVMVVTILRIGVGLLHLFQKPRWEYGRIVGVHGRNRVLEPMDRRSHQRYQTSGTSVRHGESTE